MHTECWSGNMRGTDHSGDLGVGGRILDMVWTAWIRIPTTASRPTLGPTQPPVLLLPGALNTELKASGA